MAEDFDQAPGLLGRTMSCLYDVVASGTVGGFIGYHVDPTPKGMGFGMVFGFIAGVGKCVLAEGAFTNAQRYKSEPVSAQEVTEGDATYLRVSQRSGDNVTFKRTDAGYRRIEEIEVEEVRGLEQKQAETRTRVSLEARV